MVKIKILVACSHRLSLIGLKNIFQSEKNIVIVGETTSAEETVRYALKKKPDMLLLCLKLFLENENNHLIAEVKKKLPKTKIVVFNSTLTPEQELKFAISGIMGILSSNCPAETYIKAVKQIHSGEFWFGRKLVSLLLSFNSTHRELIVPEKNKLPLTNRELDVIIQIAEGLCNKEISSKLCVSEGTVKSHINSIFKKLKINNRLQATFFAMQHNLLSSK